jgi:hypothetical protein
MTNIDVARRAYELYVARGGDHGHNVDDDWQQAERELRDAASSMMACTGSRSSPSPRADPTEGARRRHGSEIAGRRGLLNEDSKTMLD